MGLKTEDPGAVWAVKSRVQRSYRRKKKSHSEFRNQASVQLDSAGLRKQQRPFLQMEEGVADRSTNRRGDVTYVQPVGVSAPVCLSRSLLSSSLPRNIRCFYRSDQPITRSIRSETRDDNHHGSDAARELRRVQGRPRRWRQRVTVPILRAAADRSHFRSIDLLLPFAKSDHLRSIGACCLLCLAPVWALQYWLFDAGCNLMLEWMRWKLSCFFN